MNKKVSLPEKMVKSFYLFFCCVLFFMMGFAQETVKLSGKLTDLETNEPIFAANILLENTNKGTFTDENGYFEIKLSPDSYKLVVSLLGYQQITKEINLKADKYLEISLKQGSESLGEVIIKQSKKELNLRSPQMSVNTLNASDIKKIPTVLGESDVIKSLLLLPGVSNSGEGSSGFNVRGGAADQNLVLLDETTLFSDSHLFGFFSVFNPEAVQSLDLYKGGIPAKYGGRASSVLTIQQKKGNKKEFKASGGIGVVSSRLVLEGPIQKNKSSFLVAGRSSYAHLFLKLIDNPNSAYFYDLNTKFDFLINENNSLTFSGYFGRDVFNINESFKNTYGNTSTTLQWNHQFSEAINSNLYASFSDYYFGLTIDFIGFNWESGIRNYALKYDFNHYLSENIQLNYGLNASYYQFNPGYIDPSREDSGIIEKQLTKKYAWENSFYVDAEQQLSEKLNVSYGFRLNSFYRLGQEKVNIYENDQPLLFNENLKIYEKAPIIDTLEISKGKITNTFFNLEPRISASYQLNESSSVKASYQRINQYLHLISNTDAPTPLDVWAPSGRYIEPQKADQFAVGYFKKFADNTFSLETEAYYKNIKNRLDYINGADLIANDAIEQVILPGESRAYGLEILFRKNTGKLTGWIAYTLSKSQQKTEGRTPEEIGINNEEWYNTGWDKPHDISLTASYEWSKKWQFGANFVYQTGRPTTYPNGKYSYNDITVPSFSSRNSNRLPDFHHLDISATYVPSKNIGRDWKTEWVFSIYNLYNRRNAASISFSENDDTMRTEATRLSIFGIIPAVTFNFKF
ncbi:TonB-dependent receptor [Mesonia maritima]|uniref:CopG family antitoxin n=2 Tax=Mesonia maritima TaxID=1793873 RepID=A0ABU1K422_9FLAO|nr:TonB-dependent receptor [Mesonia maritima]MDR6300346.1 putative CopG family antitoxin [Mesonia maritima]